MNVPALAGGVVAAAVTIALVTAVAVLAFERLDAPSPIVVVVAGLVLAALGAYGAWLAAVVAYSAVRRSQEDA